MRMHALMIAASSGAIVVSVTVGVEDDVVVQGRVDKG
jgi:hypothetical protein